MKVHLLQHSMEMLNLTLQPNGASDILSPSVVQLFLTNPLTPISTVGLNLALIVKCTMNHLPPRTISIVPKLLMLVSLFVLLDIYKTEYFFLDLNLWHVIARCSWTVLTPKLTPRTSSLALPIFSMTTTFNFPPTPPSSLLVSILMTIISSCIPSSVKERISILM